MTNTHIHTHTHTHTHMCTTILFIYWLCLLTTPSPVHAWTQCICTCRYGCQVHELLSKARCVQAGQCAKYITFRVVIFLQREGKGTSSRVWCLLPDQLSPNPPTLNPPLTSNRNHHTLSTLKEWKLSLGQPVEGQWLRKEIKKEVGMVGNERWKKIEYYGFDWMS